jgi:hypothetical protein
LLLSAGSAAAQTVSGTVYEGSAPSKDAFVIVHWTGTRPGFGHYESVCIQAAVARTDERGRFQIKEPPPLRSTFLVWRRDPAIAVWKPGFDTQRRGDANEWSLAPTKMSPEQRAANAEGLAYYGCTDKGTLVPLVDANGALAEFRRSLSAEMSGRTPAPLRVEVLPRPAVKPAAR